LNAPARAISVVIPALDEDATIAEAIGSVREEASEVLVVDGGSRDHTREEAERAGARVLQAAAGRGVQLDLGARQATGDWLLFLHADTRLERGWAGELRALGDDVAGGAFRFALAGDRLAYRAIEWGVRLRCSIFGLPYGDQGLFTRREAYAACGGFPPLPLMEDVVFVRRLRRAGRLVRLRTRAFTSARRWEQYGVVATSASNLRRLALFTLGWPAERLAAEYRKTGGDRP